MGPSRTKQKAAGHKKGERQVESVLICKEKKWRGGRKGVKNDEKAKRHSGSCVSLEGGLRGG